MSHNTLWQIAFGDYDFALDRRALTYSLTDTKTGTVWADSLSVGWLELENQETSERTRHTFAQMKLVSLSEKSGQQGKRILLGLDCSGIPVDLYFICSQKEIQLTVEASRDTRTHNVQEICLLPGLVSVPDDGLSYLVIPHRDGVILCATDVASEETTLQIWDANNGVTMPFIGAVKNRTFNKPISALALITDSAYGAFHLARHDDGTASLDTHYSRDSERRRLDIRLVVLPEQNYVGVARAYRNKIIIDRNHVTLRQKMRERPALDLAIGAAYIIERNETLSSQLQAIGIDRQIRICDEENQEANTVFLEMLPNLKNTDRWDFLEAEANRLSARAKKSSLVGVNKKADWAAILVDVWRPGFASNPLKTAASVPIEQVIYHDSVVAPVGLWSSTAPLIHKVWWFLGAVLRIAPPLYGHRERFLDPSQDDFAIQYQEYIRRTYAVLEPLHRLSFAAFLSEHRFLTPDFKVEEARYTNGAYILINQSETDSYDNERVTLPPLGFYVEHPQMVAHDALRVGEEQFPTRACRITRSQDGKSLAESADMLRQEFLV